jgi:hypothetical protein
MNKLLKAISLVLVAALVTAGFSCKKTFDAPPATPTPSVTANHTIADLLALYPNAATSAPAVIQYNTDFIIEGVVTADDRSGNFYKTIVIQDATAGIQLLMNRSGLYTDYPIGRKVYIKMNGLVIGNYNGGIQVGGYIDNITDPANPSVGPIQSALFNTIITKGTLGNTVIPKDVLDVSALTTADQNMLIRVINTHFEAADVNQPYADAVNKNSVARYIDDIFGNPIEIYTSGYADFASDLTPAGWGNVTAIYTVYRQYPELLLRSSADVALGGPDPRLLGQDFEGTTVGSTISLPGWINYASAGSVLYKSATFSNNKYALIQAFGSGQASVVSWLVTPALNLSALTQPNKVLVFQTEAGYDNGATFGVYYSTNYTGSGNPALATWTQLPANIPPGPSSGYSSFTSSGLVNLNALSGTIYIAFKYVGADPSGTANDDTTTWEVDNIAVFGY